MASNEILNEKRAAILGLADAKKQDGTKYTYGEICEMLRLLPVDVWRIRVSHFAITNGIRRNKPHTKRKPVEESAVHPTLFLRAGDKERFLAACKAFADVYFSMEEE